MSPTLNPVCPCMRCSVAKVLAVLGIGLALLCADGPALGQVTQADCRHQARGQMQLVPLRGNFYTAQGQLGGFDPCEASVRYRVPVGGKMPLMISVHGGGGISDVQASDQAFHAAGMATLVFDAYAMQGLPGHTSLFWARSVSNEARQRMIYATALAAYEWARQREDIDAGTSTCLVSPTARPWWPTWPLWSIRTMCAA